MGPSGKWSQKDIDNIFMLKYVQGLSEPQISDYLANDNSTHKVIKVASVRYVLKRKQPSPGIPRDSMKKQTPLANMGSQFQCFKNRMPVPIDIQEGIMSQKRLQEQFLKRRNRLSKSPQVTPYQTQQGPLSHQLSLPLTSFQTSHQQLPDGEGSDSFMNFESLEDIGYAAKDLLNSLSSGPATEVQGTLNYYPGTPENVLQDSNVCIPTRKSSANSILHSIRGTKEDDPNLTFNGMNGGTNEQLPTPDPSENIFSPSNFVNSSIDASFHKLTHSNEPADYIFRGFSSMEPAENQDFSEMLDSSFDPKLWQIPFKLFEQQNEINNFSNISSPNTYLEDRKTEKELENICYPAAPLSTGNRTNFLKCHAEKKKPTTCRQKQKELIPHKFEACSMNGNRFGGIRGSPLDNPQILGENPITHLSNPIDLSHDDENSSNDTGLLTDDLQQNNFLKSNESPMDLNTSKINLHNPEFHQPFLLPTDTQFWNVKITEESNFTLHGNTPTGQVTINMFNPKFHSGCFINETFVPPNCSQEQLDTLYGRSLL